MLIRHKIILWFIIFSGLLLSLFSIYIYVASARSREKSFLERIKNKATATKEIYELNDKVAEKIITSITEQSEYVFDENNHLIFAINDLHDFTFDSSFFNLVKKKKEYIFKYTGKLNELKEGYAFTFMKGNKLRTAAIMAYNKSGIEILESLKSILIIGNLFFLTAVGLAAYAFSIYVFRPVKALVAQAESATGHDLSFRLTYVNAQDEIGIVASSFNKALDRIQKLVDSQKSFISYASHELRTPLAAVNGILETSLNYDKESESMRESMQAAHKEILKATNLVNGLLQLAKIESQDVVIEKSRINMVDVLLDAIDFYKMKKPFQEFSFNIPDTNKETSIEVYGNTGLLRTALINLVDNASKYSNQKKIEIKLVVETNERITIKIIDQGIGLNTDENIQLFEPFYRGKNASGFEGFGLGLPLTKRIVTLHHGSLNLVKNEFSGITAELTLPATISSASGY